VVKAIIFDFDMTLLDTSGAGDYSREMITREKDVDFSVVPQKAAYGMTFDEVCEKIADLNPGKVTALELKYLDRKYFVEYLNDKKVGHVEFLNGLREKGIRLGIVSNNILDVIEPVLENSDVPFDFVYCSENHGAGKTELIVRGIEALGLSADDCFYVGDHYMDIGHANDAGVRCIAITTGFFSAEELINYKPYGIISKIEDLERFI